jgi:hypothetical protein
MNTEVINRMIRGEVNQISELSYAKLVASVSAYSAKLRTSTFALRLQLCKLLTKKKLIFFFVLKFICADIYFAQLGCWYTQILTPWKRNYRNPLYYLGITILEREKWQFFPIFELFYSDRRIKEIIIKKNFRILIS